MWKKGESEEVAARVAPPTAVPAPTATRTDPKRGEAATIGPSIHIKGDVTGSEDLIIQGRIEGNVTLKQNHVTIGADGRVKANVNARTVTVEGEVEGDLAGQEQIVLRRSARVVGNISAPRVSLEDGAVFRGGIDMQEQGAGLTSVKSSPAKGHDPDERPSPDRSAVSAAKGDHAKG